MKQTCEKCQSPIEKEDKFCGYCGFKLIHQLVPVARTEVELKLSEIRVNLANIYYRKNDFHKALEIYEKILEEEPGNTEVQAMMGLARDALAQENN